MSSEKKPLRTAPRSLFLSLSCDLEGPRRVSAVQEARQEQAAPVEAVARPPEAAAPAPQRLPVESASVLVSSTLQPGGLKTAHERPGTPIVFHRKAHPAPAEPASGKPTVDLQAVSKQAQAAPPQAAPAEQARQHWLSDFLGVRRKDEERDLAKETGLSVTLKRKDH
jgi:hypothetical protein